MRLAVYLDYEHRREQGRIFAPRAFAMFVAGLRAEFERVTVVGRVDPAPGRSHYPVPPELAFVEMPHYASAADPWQLTRVTREALRRWNAVLRDVDVVWVLGPQGLALPLVLSALMRRKRVVLGVRQDLPSYARSRHPSRRMVHVAADLLEFAFRSLGRITPVIAVGPALAARYARGRAVLPVTISLVHERELDPPREQRDWDHERIVLSVGRLEEEKNPLLLADVLARLRATDPRWRLVVCGEGPLEAALRHRLIDLGVSDAADLRGYVPLDGGLRDMYRQAHAFLHVSHTEGLPQVLFEAFAAGLPVVATAVGSVAEASGDAALLVEPDDADAAVAKLRELGNDERLRARLIEAGIARVREHTMEAELRRTAAFLKGIPGDHRPSSSGRLSRIGSPLSTTRSGRSVSSPSKFTGTPP